MRIEGTDGDDVIVGTEDADVIVGKAGNDWISGTGGADDIDAGAGVDHVDGGAGEDVVRSTSVFNSHGSQYDGGTGIDTLDLSAIGADRYLRWTWTSSTDLTVEDTKVYNEYKSFSAKNFEVFVGTGGSDSFNLRETDILLEVHAGGGNDFIEASYTNAIIYGDDGNDYIFISPEGKVFGGSGDDSINVWSGIYWPADGVFDGGSGQDLLQLYSPLDVDLSENTLSSGYFTTTLYNIENVSAGVSLWATASIVGNDSNNTFNVNAYTDEGGGANFYGRGGDDLLKGGKGADLLDGGAGFDTASYETSKAGVTVSLARSGPQDTGGAGADTLVDIEAVKGSTFNDVLTGGISGTTTLEGDGGDDILYASSGASRLSGGEGGDHLYGAAAKDALDGGAGFDLARYDTSTQAVLVNLVTGAGTGGYADGDTYVNVEGAVGSAFNDALYGNADSNLLYGQAGDDVLSGGLGADTLEGGDGADHLYGGAGADSLRGGAGYDFARYDEASSLVTVDLGRGAGFSGEAFGDSFSSIEGLVGSAFGDALTGDGGDNTLYGQSGDDVLRGEAGSDRLDGGVGNDHLYGGVGGDVLVGGDGYDLARYDMSDAIYVDLSLGRGFSGEATGDVLISIEGVVGSGQADLLIGDAAANSIYGQAGDDQIWGGGGADLLDGGAGVDLVRFDLANAQGVVVDLKAGLTSEGDRLSGFEGLVATDAGDVLFGGDGGEVIYALGGDDRIVGGGGDDRLYGGAGADSFAFDSRSGSDLIMDFNAKGAGHDVIAIQKNVNGSGIVDFASLLSHIQNIGTTDVRIDLGGGASIGLFDVRAADLSASLFVFY
jgi:Ca2+-binding RTX toxin-like protein